MLDLFEYTLTVPTPSSDLAPVAATPPVPIGLSEAELAQQLVRLATEVQRRLEKGRGNHPELAAAAERARASLDQVAPQRSSKGKVPRGAKRAFPLQAGQRKAVQAALLAGVTPAQAAKHFGLSLAAVRKVFEETAEPALLTPARR